MENEKDLEKLKEIIKEVEKTYGKGSIMCLGDKPSTDIDVISSGSILLNEALGVGGYPRGRIIEIFGPESSGKTTLSLTAIAEAQKRGEKCAFIDAEHSVDPIYAQTLGVKINQLILSQPDNGEQALDIVELLARSGVFSLIVVDSVAALVPKAELEGEMVENQVGLHARLMSKGLRKIAGVLSKSNTTIIFINQLREKIGVFYGNPETTTGGRALKFYSSIRIDIRKSDAIKQNNDIIGNTVVCKVVKNKVASPFKSCKFDIIYGKGISKEGELLDLGTALGIIKKSGSWYEYNGNKIGQGRETAKIFLENHKEIFEEIRNTIVSGEVKS